MIRTFLSFFVFAVAAAGQFPHVVLPDNLQEHFALSGLPAENRTVVPVEGMAFDWAWRLDTPPNEETKAWTYTLRGKGTTAVHEGDFLLAEFWVRTARTSGEAGVVRFVCQVDSDPYEKSASWVAAAGGEWTKVEVPFKMAGTYRAEEWSVQFWIAYPEQTLEVGGLSVVNHGPGKSWRDFQFGAYPYRGREADAPWRFAAAERIEKYRKGEIVVVARDEEGNPVANAPVTVTMKEHRFRFGAAVTASRINDGNETAYRSAVLESFNSVTIRNALKWRQWDKDRAPGIQAADWAIGNRLTVRGHTVVWPGWRYLPDWLQGLADKPEQLRLTVRDHVTDVTAATRGKLIDWDVVNEAHTNRDLQEILGEAEMAEWFRLVRMSDPDAKLYINDYDIVSSGGWDVTHQKGYQRLIDLLEANGAPVDGIGLQAHFNSGQATDIERAIEVMERFAGNGKDLLITEFTFDMADEDLQAEYTRDFLTAAFSVPAVKGFYNWNFWEDDGQRPHAAMYRKDGSLKGSGRAWRRLTGERWWTDAGGFTDADGLFRTRGFLGDYDVTVDRGEGVETLALSVDDPRSPAYSLTGKQAAGSFRADGVLNGASFRGGAVAPGEIVTIFGEGFGPPQLERVEYSDGLLPTSAGDTRVLFDGTPAPMIYSLAGQVSAIVPYGVSGRTTIEIEYLGTKSGLVSLPVAEAAPAVFCYAGGRGQAVAVNDSSIFNRHETPVKRGAILTFFITGEGRVTRGIADGSRPAAPDFPAPVKELTVFVGAKRCEVLFAGLIYAGVTQVNIRVPLNSLSGPTIPLQVALGDAVSPDDVFVSVE